MKSGNKYISGSIFLISLISILSMIPNKSSGQEYAIGADLSFLKSTEDGGHVFKENNVPKPGLQIFTDHGYNWIRLRLFHSPTNLPNNLEYTIALAKSAKELGMKFLLDYHYSDTWADPGKQFIPKAWNGMSHKELVKAVFDYSKETIIAFRKAGVMPDMVHVPVPVERLQEVYAVLARDAPERSTSDQVIEEGYPAGWSKALRGAPLVTISGGGTFDAAGIAPGTKIADLRVSAHFLIRRDGRVIQFVACDRRAWHAGQSAWRGRENCNDYAVGIELEGSDNQPFSAAQYETLWKVIDALRARYPVTAIAGHCHVAPERKTDPGPFFDWPALAGRYPALGPASEEAT